MARDSRLPTLGYWLFLTFHASPLSVAENRPPPRPRPLPPTPVPVPNGSGKSTTPQATGLPSAIPAATTLLRSPALTAPARSPPQTSHPPPSSPNSKPGSRQSARSD